MIRVTVLCVVSLVALMGPAVGQQPADPSNPAATASANPSPANPPPASSASASLSGAPTDPNLTVATVTMQDGFRISKLIGSAVYNDQNEKVGTLDDLITKDGHNIVMAIVSVGGFLGIGNKLVAVPYDQLHLQMDKDGTKVALPGASKDALNAMPTFTYSG
jgi:sporulation protein YlmC with PRC-barrel domain